MGFRERIAFWLVSTIAMAIGFVIHVSADDDITGAAGDALIIYGAVQMMLVIGFEMWRERRKR